MPTVTPVTTPPATVATPVELLLHTPPPTASVKVTVLPVQTDAEDGDTPAGVVFTVMIFVAEHPAAVV